MSWKLEFETLGHLKRMKLFQVVWGEVRGGACELLGIEQNWPQSQAEITELKAQVHRFTPGSLLSNLELVVIEPGPWEEGMVRGPEGSGWGREDGESAETGSRTGAPGPVSTTPTPLGALLSTPRLGGTTLCDLRRNAVPSKASLMVL